MLLRCQRIVSYYADFQICSSYVDWDKHRPNKYTSVQELRSISMLFRNFKLRRGKKNLNIIWRKFIIKLITEKVW